LAAGRRAQTHEATRVSELGLDTAEIIEEDEPPFGRLRTVTT
jgi:hypothetical protein